MDYYLHSYDLIGDTLMQTPAIRALRMSGKADKIYYVTAEDSLNRILFQNDHFIDELLLPSEEVSARPGKHVELTAMGAYNAGHQFKCTMMEGYGQLIDVPVADTSYHLHLTPEERRQGRQLVEELGGGKPVIFVGRHSYSCTSNDPKIGVPNIMLPNTAWVETAEWLIKQGLVPVAIGSKDHGEDPRFQEWPGVKSYGIPLRILAGAMRAATMVTAVNTGMRHLAGAAGANLYCPVGTTPLWLVRLAPQHQFQRILEENVDVNNTTSERLIAGIQAVLN